jgi:DNA-binding NarL/FixJ family response regulator
MAMIAMNRRKMTQMGEPEQVLSASVRVLVVEDHESYRAFVLSVLKTRPDFQVIAQAMDGAEAIRSAEELRPDLILLDIGLPGLNGIEVARRVSLLSPKSRILFVSQESSDEVVQAALATGAVGYVLKTDAARDLMPAISSALVGSRFVSRSIATLRRMLRPSDSDDPALSPSRKSRSS